MPRNKALILVDVQNDFLPGGALGVPDGHLATPLLWELMEDVDVLVFTRDWHPADHSSFSSDPEYRDGSWPPHCIRGTNGALFDDMTFERGLDTRKPLLVVNKGQVKEKEAYSGFDPRGAVALQFNIYNISLVGSTLSQALMALGVREIKIGGLALDYCVKATALDARAWTGNTTVYLNATRPVDYLTGAQAVAELAAAGVRLDGRVH